MQLKLPFLYAFAFLSAIPRTAALIVYDSTITEIQQTLAKFPLSVDSHDYGLLSQVFAPDGAFNAALPSGPFQGLATIQKWLAGALNNTVSQHSFGTQCVEVLDSHSANVTTYFIATFVGIREKAGSSLYNHAKYIDTLTRNDKGDWRIKVKKLIYMVRPYHAMYGASFNS